MGFAFIIIIRILFAACMVFIIGFVFGSFSKRPVLRTITKIAAILAIVLFIMSNVFLMRFSHPGWNGRGGCSQDTLEYQRHHGWNDHANEQKTVALQYDGS